MVATAESSAAVKTQFSHVFFFPGYSCTSKAEAFSWHGPARGYFGTAIAY